jgi:succinoglycan biosynthesis transport protein ExoP
MTKEMMVLRGPPVQDVGREARQLFLPSMADSGEVDLRSFARMVYRRKLMLFLIMAAALSLTAYWIAHATPHYSADALIVIQSRPSSIVRVDQAVQDVSGDNAAVNTEVAILKSRGLAARVINELGLDGDPEFDPKASPAGFLAKIHSTVLFATVSDWVSSAQSLLTDTAVGGGVSAADSVEPGNPAEGATTNNVVELKDLAAVSDWLKRMQSETTVTAAGNDVSAAASGETGNPRESTTTERMSAFNIRESREHAALLEGFLTHLTVEPEDASRLINISFTSTDPSKAATITNRLVETYIENQLETKTEGARRAAEWLEVRLAELGKTVQELEQSVQQQRADSGLAENNGTGIVAQRLSQLNAALVAAQADSAATRTRYQQVRAVLESGGNIEALPSIIASASIQALRSKRSDLASGLSELEAIYGAQHPQILSLRAEMAEVERRLQEEIDNILTGLRNEVRTAGMREDALRTDLASVGKEVVRLNQAEASIGQVAQRLTASRDLYMSLLKRHTEAVALRDNQQPDARIISSAQIPLRPSYPNVPKVMALSFVGSASFAILVLVVVERLRQKLDTVEDVERQVGLQVIGTIPDLPRLWRLTSAPGDYIHREPLSEFGGAFQRLRALLALGNGNGRKMPRTLLVTSASAGEGKTTIAVCLGVASVSSGQKVLLVDCDFGRPQIHRMLEVKNEKGLTDILTGSATLQEAVIDLAEYNLSILTIGRSREGAIDLLNSERMADVLNGLKHVYDLIILDSPPVLEVSNALILGSLADRTILVTRREWTIHRRASYAAKQLQLYGADIAGVVFNRTGPTSNYSA